MPAPAPRSQQGKHRVEKQGGGLDKHKLAKISVKMGSKTQTKMSAPASRSQQGRQDELAQTFTKLKKAEKLVSRQSWINVKNAALRSQQGEQRGDWHRVAKSKAKCKF